MEQTTMPYVATNIGRAQAESPGIEVSVNNLNARLSDLNSSIVAIADKLGASLPPVECATPGLPGISGSLRAAHDWLDTIESRVKNLFAAL